MKENVDYKIIPYDPDSSAIELLCDPYKGVQFIYGFVKVNEDNGMLNLKFDSTIIGDIKVPENQLEQFKKIAGDVLVDIMVNNVEESVEDDEQY